MRKISPENGQTALDYVLMLAPLAVVIAFSLAIVALLGQP